MRKVWTDPTVWTEYVESTASPDTVGRRVTPVSWEKTVLEANKAKTDHVDHMVKRVTSGELYCFLLLFRSKKIHQCSHVL